MARAGEISRCCRCAGPRHGLWDHFGHEENARALCHKTEQSFLQEVLGGDLPTSVAVLEATQARFQRLDQSRDHQLAIARHDGKAPEQIMIQISPVWLSLSPRCISQTRQTSSIGWMLYSGEQRLVHDPMLTGRVVFAVIPLIQRNLCRVHKTGYVRRKRIKINILYFSRPEHKNC